MKRVWFTAEMKQAILDGRKTATTRNHPLDLAKYQAVSGSRYKAQPFAVIEFTEQYPMMLALVVSAWFKAEGFNSSEEMVEFLRKKRLMKTPSDAVYFHRFRVVDVIKGEVKS